MFNILKTVRNLRSRSVAIRSLNQMDDRLLADIGVTRADIPSFVRGLR